MGIDTNNKAIDLCCALRFQLNPPSGLRIEAGAAPDFKGEAHLDAVNHVLAGPEHVF